MTQAENNCSAVVQQASAGAVKVAQTWLGRSYNGSLPALCESEYRGICRRFHCYYCTVNNPCPCCLGDW